MVKVDIDSNQGYYIFVAEAPHKVRAEGKNPRPSSFIYFVVSKVTQSLRQRKQQERVEIFS
ncbi:hypothetical protein GCM10010916_38520 [Paenibacillus abyssi]|uniref:Uncharacterized protein n=1 Tax=Paenibacillus abyssi TaxID=1340531 RepID=A0A917LFK0_9BACL|nr:hypothetical protein GCM10010916_38520 [Paenibacillus abyssi]